MAGGLGKRMNSNVPKVLHKVSNIPMIVRIIKQAEFLNPSNILIVVGKYRNIIEKTLDEYLDINKLTFINQPESNGTGHAIMCCKDFLESYRFSHPHDKNVLILSGDTPLISFKTMNSIINYTIDNNYMNTMMTAELENPYGNGRIIRGRDNIFSRICEEKDCDEDEKKIKEINCGIYVLNIDTICQNIMSLTNNNAQHEYYLTDLFQIIIHKYKSENKSDNILGIYKLENDKQYELLNVNTPEQLNAAEIYLQNYI